MLDNILNIVKEQAMNIISDNAEIPAGKKDETVQATTHAIATGLEQNLNLSNISELGSLFGGGSNLASNPIISKIEGTVVNALVQKVGLSQGISTTIATTVINAIVQAISGKIQDPNEKGFSLDSVIGAFTGKNSGSSGGNLLSSLGKLFG